MSAFNPNNRNLMPQEWQAIASESIADDNSQYLIIGGIVGGLLAASATGFPPTGLLIAVWGFYRAWKKTQGVNKNEEIINTYKCVAHVLQGDGLKDYRRQIGDRQVVEEIQFAKERGCTLSGDAEDFLEAQSPAILPPTPQVRIQAVSKTETKISNYTPPNQQEFDVIGRMVKDLTNHLILGVPGSGKGILISNALDAIKRQHPNLTIFYVDPKGDEKETGYFYGRVDVLKRAKIIDMPPEDAVAWIQNCIEEFQSIQGDKLLVLDEGTAVTSKFKNTKGALPWLKDKIVSYCSCGDSAGLRVWIVVQNAHTDDLGINGGLRSQLVPIAIINPKNIAAYSAVVATTLIPSDKKLESMQIMEIAKKSPVARAIYHGGINKWLPMPELQNYSGYNRDSRAFTKDALSPIEREELKQATATPPITHSCPASQAEKMLGMLQATTETSLDAFIRNELRVTRGDKKKQVREAIVEILKDKPDLLKKFGLN